MPKVVSNTTPIISLLKLNRLDLLKQLYTQIYIPVAVYHEIEAGKTKEFYKDLSKINWIKIIEIKDKQAIKYFLDLDSGEAEAIILATDLDADLIVLDDALIDGDTGHDDDELAEAVFLIEFVDRAEVDVGLAGAGLHLDGEVGVAPRIGADAFKEQAFVHLEVHRAVEELAVGVVGVLHGTDVGVQPASVELFVGVEVAYDALAQRRVGLIAGHSCEDVHDALDGLLLVVEIRIELELKFGHLYSFCLLNQIT